MSRPRPVDDEITVVELRRYRLHPGRREELIELFERDFLEPQVAAGMSILGQFRDIDHPDTFTWLRGFSDMAARRRALDAFYGGPVWATHRDAANATMVDSDDVHLLRPRAGLAAGQPDHRSPHDGLDRRGPARRIAIVVGRLVDAASVADRARAHQRFVFPGWTRVAAMETLQTVNDFPALPVNDDDVVVAVLAADTPASPWLDPSAIVDAARGPITHASVLRLEPTDRSRLR